MKLELPQYINQERDGKGLKLDSHNLCGAASVCMMSGENFKDIAVKIKESSPDNVLIDYLKSKGFTCKKITDGGAENTRWFFTPGKKEFTSMRKALDEGYYVLYHWGNFDKLSNGHYSVCVGYHDNIFIFCDPAGKHGQYFGKADEGKDVEYSENILIKAGMARAWACKLEDE